MKRRLGLPKRDLEFYLEKVRRISRMEPEDALSELDEFLCTVLSDHIVDVVGEDDDDPEANTGEEEGEEENDKYYDDDKARILKDIRDIEASIAELRSRIQRGAFDSESDAVAEGISNLGVRAGAEGEIGQFCLGWKAMNEMERQIKAVQTIANDVAAAKSWERVR